MLTRVPDPESFATGGLTDVGQVRTVNQDYCDELFDPTTGRRLLVLADGMGGHRGGEVASQLAVEAVGRAFSAGASADAGELLCTALESANALVYEKALSTPALAGMGTTCVCVLFEAPGRCAVAHVGDSRAYQLRDGKFSQITEDHSVVGSLIRMGHITEAEARLHPQRNEILRAIGTHAHVEVQMTEFDLEPGDRYLVCSDGLSGMVTDDEIRDVLATESPEAAARILVGMANLEGGTDNITVQIAVIPSEPVGALPTVDREPSPAATEPWNGERTEPLGDSDAGDAGRPLVWLLVGGALLAGVLGWLFLR